MSFGILLFINKPDPNRPVEDKYVVQLDGELISSFEDKSDAMLFMYDRGVRHFQYLTKEIEKYKDISKLQTYEFWHIENRIGYVVYDYESYVVKDVVKKRKAFVWRFVGHGKSCFAETKEALLERVIKEINHYKDDPKGRGYNDYPYYTRYYRNQERTL